MEKLAGVVATFDHAMILNQDMRYFGWVRADLVDLAVRHARPMHLEIAVGGYNDDPRSLYEVPEVRRWIRRAQESWPDAMFWLTPGSLWIWMLSLNPKMVERRPDGLVQVSLDTEVVTGQYAQALVAGEDALAARGVEGEALEAIVATATSGLGKMFKRQKPGVDYTVLHPDSGEVVYYRRQP